MMRNSRRRALTLSTSALAAVLVLGAPQATAQTLFEFLFGERNEQTRQVVRPQPAEAPRATPSRPASLPRVAGPSFYEYRADPLVRVDFASIAIPVQEAANAAEGQGLLVASAEGIDADVLDSARQHPRESSVRPADVSIEQVPAVAANGEALKRMSANPRVIGVVDPAFDEDETPAAQPSMENIETIVSAPPRLTEAVLEALDEYELYAEKAAAEALIEHYSAHPEFIWVSDERPNAAASQALEVLGDAASHGLDPAHYLVAVPGSGATEAELARFEMALSARILRYARDVHGGRIDANRISGYHDLAVKEVDYGAELLELAATDDLRTHLNSHHPQNDFYRQLRVELEVLRAAGENDIVVKPDTFVRPGQTNPEFAKILELIERDADDAFRAEHGELLVRHRGSEQYAEELVPVIRGAQAARNLHVDGIIGPQTVRGLAGESRAGRIEKVKLALERLRWLPSDLTDRYVFLNAPSFTAAYFENGQQKLSMRAIYGNTSRQTYFFKDRVSYVEFHPYWGVPRSILVNTYLSRLINDPGYLDRGGFEVTDRQGRKVSSSSINWGRYGANIPYDVRQLPGPRNALGELKIMFPNKHAIYMHDTPDRHLFDRIDRAISNGCIRLEDPRAMAAAVLGWDVDDVADRLRGPHSRENLSTEVPVYVAYFTAWPDETGKVVYHGDSYSRDGRLAQAIERVERSRTPSS